MRLDKEIAKYYYTAAQARKVLGMDEQKFQYEVRKGIVKKTTLPGRSQGLYSKREVNELAGRIEAAIIAERPEGIEFRKATIDDLEAEYDLAYLIFGKGAHTIEVRQGLMEQNPDITYHLYDYSKLVASITIIPFNQETIEAFMSGQTRGWEIDPTNVEQFTPNKLIECIMMEMMTTSTVPPEKRGFYGSRLLTGLSNVFTIWGEHGIEITKLHATSSTPTGIHILNSAGFQVVQNLGRGRLAFELDIQQSDAKIIRNYKEALQEWKEKQINLKKRKNRKPVVPSSQI